MDKRKALFVLLIIVVATGLIVGTIILIRGNNKSNYSDYTNWQEGQDSYVTEVTTDIGVYYNVTGESETIAAYLQENGYKGNIDKISLEFEEGAGTPVGVPQFVIDSGVDHYYSLYNDVDGKFYAIVYLDGEIIIQESEEE